jgi:hypothetical protein
MGYTFADIIAVFAFTGPECHDIAQAALERAELISRGAELLEHAGWATFSDDIVACYGPHAAIGGAS